jgi:polar amino acid transport system substrate-binding protein
MKRRALAIAVLAIGAACVLPSSASSGELPTRTPGVLTVGLSLPSPGFQTGGVRGTNELHPKGMEIELAMDIAQQLGLATVKFSNVAAFSEISSSGPKPYDFALAEVTIDRARARKVTFSTPYYDANLGVLLRKGLSPVPRSIADLRKLVLCAPTGTTGASYIRTRIRPSTAPLFPQLTAEMYQQLLSRRCDVAIYDAPILAGQTASDPSAYGPIVGQIQTGQRYGLVFAKGSKLLPAVNAIIAKMTADGTISKLARKYLRTDVAKLPAFR